MKKLCGWLWNMGLVLDGGIKMGLIVGAGVTALTGSSGVGALPILALEQAVDALLRDWARVGVNTYAIRGTVGDFRRLLSRSPGMDMGGGRMRVLVKIEQPITPLSTFQFIATRGEAGGGSRVHKALRGMRSKSLSHRVAAGVQTRALRTSPFKPVVDRRTGLPGWWNEAQGSIFVRNQRATWSGGRRLPTHRMLTLPLGAWLNSERVRAEVGLVARVAELGGTVRRIM